MITIIAETDFMGSLILRPKSKKVAAMVAASNEYDGSSDCYFQRDYDEREVIEQYIPKRYHNHLKRGYRVAFLLDEWIYRHLVGGQSD